MTFKHVAPLLWCQSIIFLWISLQSSPVNGFSIHPPSSKLTSPASLSSSTTSLNAFKFPTLSLPWDAPQKTESATVGERNGLDPEYPWRFEGRFIFRPSLVRTDSGLDGNGGPPSATLLSLFGYSLGGSVILEYDISPVGPYR